MLSLRLALAGLILVLFTTRIGAQPDSATRAQHIESEVAKWRSALSLTDAQTVNVRRIMAEQQAELDRSEATLEHTPEADRSQMATDLEHRMHSYDDHFDAALDPWQRERARQQGLYDAHIVIVLNWWPWWYHWHPYWHPHHRWWRHRHHPPRPLPPPRHPPQPPIPPRPGPRFDQHGSGEPRREKPQAQPNNPRQEKRNVQPQSNPRPEKPPNNPRQEKPKDNGRPSEGPHRSPAN